MSKIIVVLTLAFLASAAEDKKKLTDSEAAGFLKQRNAVIQAQADFQRKIQDMLDMQSKLRKKYGVGENCELDGQAEWICQEAASEQKDEEQKKADK